MAADVNLFADPKQWEQHGWDIPAEHPSTKTLEEHFLAGAA
jgi:hypothetical protein